MNISSQCGFCKQLLTDAGERVDIKIGNHILDWLDDFPDKYPNVRNIRTKPFWCHICFGLSASIVQTLFDLGDRLQGRLTDNCDDSSTDEQDYQSALSSCMQSPKPRIIQPMSYPRSQFMEVEENSSEQEQVFPALSNSVSPAQAFQAGAGQLTSPLFPNLTSVVQGGGPFGSYSIEPDSPNSLLGSGDSQPGSFQMHQFLSLPSKRKHMHNGTSFVDGAPPAKKLILPNTARPSVAPVSPASSSSSSAAPSPATPLHTSPSSITSKPSPTITTQTGIISKPPSIMPQKPVQKSPLTRVSNPTSIHPDNLSALGKPIKPKRYTPKKNRPQFICVVCGQSLCSKNWLDNHLRKHGITDPSKYHNPTHSPESIITTTTPVATTIQVMPAISAEGTPGIAVSPASSSFQIAGAISSEGTPGIVVAPASAKLPHQQEIRPKLQMPPVVPVQNLLHQNEMSAASNALKLANAVSTMSSTAPVLQFNTSGEPATSLTEDQAAKLTTIAATAANMLQCTRKGKKKGIQYQCPVCYRVLRSVAWLDNHMKKHFETNAMECPICQRTFTDRKNFKRHYRLHQDDTPYKCLLCEKKCGRNKDLKYHMLKHVHEMNSGQCPICGQKYASNVALQNHIEVSHTRFVKLLNKARKDEDALIEAVEVTGEDEESQDGDDLEDENHSITPIKIQPITDEDSGSEYEEAVGKLCNGAPTGGGDADNNHSTDTNMKTDLIKEKDYENHNNPPPPPGQTAASSSVKSELATTPDTNQVEQNGVKVPISELGPPIFSTPEPSISIVPPPENLTQQVDHDRTEEMPQSLSLEVNNQNDQNEEMSQNSSLEVNTQNDRQEEISQISSLEVNIQNDGQEEMSQNSSLEVNNQNDQNEEMSQISSLEVSNQNDQNEEMSQNLSLEVNIQNDRTEEMSQKSLEVNNQNDRQGELSQKSSLEVDNQNDPHEEMLQKSSLEVNNPNDQNGDMSQNSSLEVNKQNELKSEASNPPILTC